MCRPFKGQVFKVGPVSTDSAMLAAFDKPREEEKFVHLTGGIHSVR